MVLTNGKETYTLSDPVMIGAFKKSGYQEVRAEHDPHEELPKAPPDEPKKESKK